MLDLLDFLLGRHPLGHQVFRKGKHGIAVGVFIALRRGPVEYFVVRERVAVGPNHVGVNQGRALALPSVLDRLLDDVIGGEWIAAVDLLDKESRESSHQLRDRTAGGVDLDRHRNGVLVVLDQIDDRELEIAGGVEGLPKLALARGTVAGGDEDDFVGLGVLIPIRNLIVLTVSEPGFGGAHRLEELGSGRARRADDIEVFVTPVRRHLATAGVRVVGGGDGREQHFGGGHAEAETQGPVAVVEIEPVV